MSCQAGERTQWIKCLLHKQEDLSLDPSGKPREGPCLPLIPLGSNLDSSSCALGDSLALLLVLVEPQAAPLPQFTHLSGEKDAPCLVILLEHPGPMPLLLLLFLEDKTAGPAHHRLIPGPIPHRGLWAEQVLSGWALPLRRHLSALWSLCLFSPAVLVLCLLLCFTV